MVRNTQKSTWKDIKWVASSVPQKTPWDHLKAFHRDPCGRSEREKATHSLEQFCRVFLCFKCRCLNNLSARFVVSENRPFPGIELPPISPRECSKRGKDGEPLTVTLLRVQYLRKLQLRPRTARWKRWHEHEHGIHVLTDLFLWPPFLLHSQAKSTATAEQPCYEICMGGGFGQGKTTLWAESNLKCSDTGRKKLAWYDSWNRSGTLIRFNSFHPFHG